MEAEADRLELWKRYLDYEFLYGDRATIQSLTVRFKETFSHLPIADDLSLSIRQHGYAELMPVPERAWALLPATHPEETAQEVAQLQDSNVAPFPAPHMPDSNASAFAAPHVFPFPLLGDEVTSLLLSLPAWEGPTVQVPALVRALLCCFRQPVVPPQAAAPVAPPARTGPSERRSTRPTRGKTSFITEPIPLGRKTQEKDLLEERFSGRLK